MPEGDTIHTVARVMAPALVGQRLALLEVDQVARPWSLGAEVSSCEAVGKHLVIELVAMGGERYSLRVHLGMKGSWHRYRKGEPWLRPPSRRRVVLDAHRWLFVCFGPKEVEVLGEGAFVRSQVAHLGPDLLGKDFDLDEVLRRARLPEHRALAVADLLLTQTVAAGIGNVYKSELLFLERVDPFRPIAALSDEALAALYRRARPLMQDNLESGGWRITTTRPAFATGFGPDRIIPRHERHWVYRRAKRPCFECGTLVQSRLQGPMARMTYWCGRCQR
jgi:endonuclease-8